MLMTARSFRISIIISILSLLLIFLSVASVCFAAVNQEPVGSVVAVRGKVVAINVQGESRSLSIKSPLFLNDTVNTGKRGRLQVLFRDTSIISLGADSIVKISEYAWDPDTDKAAITTEVKEGVFRVMGGLISKKAPARFKTETPMATIGIRGSMYAGKVSGKGLEVVFEGGKGIDLTNATGTVAITNAGFGLQIRSWNAAIPKPAKFTSKTIRSLRQEFTYRRPGKPKGKGVTRRTLRAALPVTFDRGEITGPEKPGVKGGKDKETLEQQGETDKKTKPEDTKKKKGDKVEREASQEQKELAQELTAAAKENPKEAVNILQEAVAGEKVNLEQALEAILSGMQNIDKNSFESLIHEAVDMGLTADEAKKIAEQLKASGGGCP